MSIELPDLAAGATIRMTLQWALICVRTIGIWVKAGLTYMLGPDWNSWAIQIAESFGTAFLLTLRGEAYEFSDISPAFD